MSVIRNLFIKVVVLEEALITLLAILEEKEILSKQEQYDIINAIEMKLKAKE